MKASHVIAWALLGALKIVALAVAVLVLWNWLVPAILGLSAITFGQAVGIILICRVAGLLLFGHRRYGRHAVGARADDGGHGDGTRWCYRRATGAPTR